MVLSVLPDAALTGHLGADFQNFITHHNPTPPISHRPPPRGWRNHPLRTIVRPPLPVVWKDGPPPIKSLAGASTAAIVAAL